MVNNSFEGNVEDEKESRSNLHANWIKRFTFNWQHIKRMKILSFAYSSWSDPNPTNMELLTLPSWFLDRSLYTEKRKRKMQAMNNITWAHIFFNKQETEMYKQKWETVNITYRFTLEIFMSTAGYDLSLSQYFNLERAFMYNEAFMCIRNTFFSSCIQQTEYNYFSIS